ncbi:MAG: glycosyltransferase family 2 protein [Gammaproteobacteria bacterium]|nr:glycosyltransferase family 2 protein [Gammaproteobacteria bacterium]
MASSQPLVSIGLPVYNGSNYIEKTIESILSQSYENFELIICDNASTDATASICERFVATDKRVSYFRQQKNLGASRNFNSTFEKASGKYFKWASHDDLLGPDNIRDCVEFLENHDDYVICWPHMDYIDENDNHLRNQSIVNLSMEGDSFVSRIHDLFNFQIAGDDVVPTIFALVRSSALANTRLWQRFTSSEEILMLELLMQGKVKQLEQTGLHFRIHNESAFHKNRTPAEREKWFDTEKHYVLQFPVWFLLVRYFNLVAHSRLDLWEKLRCYYQIIRRAVFLWRRYLGDIVKFLGQFVGYRFEYKDAS